ncbi:hypothetical protein DM860_010680 [Cuscuta australis]|uniref:CCR4-NOT transcription complex subunit 3 n=1 Tax=Cuscuta australis TaxID=267555 RepID=A0A328E1T2_9ASTE|nr:hypothetical protein DM860_010680 [Cuscuta australis]
MGASRKLQGEIDRVLKRVQEGVDLFDSIWKKVYDTDNANQKEKFEADLKKEIKKLQRYRDQIKTWLQSSEIKDKKVSASYEQALMDARKLIEREMERFKICEKETKTKAFSKEGLGQQPKTDPKEKAKSETRDWLNNVVSELENQIDIFEAELEGLTVKKGKSKPPRMTHLETSITRHRAHIMKLELILRLLDNDELSPEQVNDIKDFLDDYVERNQDDFGEFSDVDELYSSLPLDKVEALEDLVTIGTPGLVKGVSAIVSTKISIATTPSQASLKITPPAQQSGPSQEQPDGLGSPESTSDAVARTLPPKIGAVSASAPATSVGGRASTVASSPMNLLSAVKDEGVTVFPGRKASPTHAEPGLRGIDRNDFFSQPAASISLGSINSLSNDEALGATSSVSEVTKRNCLGFDERLGTTGNGQPLISPLANRSSMSQTVRSSDGMGTNDSGNVVESSVLAGRGFSSSVLPAMQWRSGGSFQNQNEAGQIRGRTEIAPDQREKYLQRFHQGQSYIPGSHKQFYPHHQNPLLHQFNSQGSSVTPQLGLGAGAQASSPLNDASSFSNESPSALVQQQSDGSRHSKVEELRQQAQCEDVLAASAPSSSLVKNLMNEDDFKAYATDNSGGVGSSVAEQPQQLPKDIVDLSPGKPLQPNQPSGGSIGVIGRRSVADLGAIGDNLITPPANPGVVHDLSYNLQMLESAYRTLPHPKDSERAKSYTPRHPVVTPSSYPQVQAPMVSNPSFWERLGADNICTETLFFAFYYQQNTYQQYLAAKELRKQTWRYHRLYNTWFRRLEEPTDATDDYESGTYLYFDITNEEQHGWCQRIRTDFTFEYKYLEDDLPA